MDLEQQIQKLIKNAPQDGSTPQIVEAITPCLLYTSDAADDW